MDDLHSNRMKQTDLVEVVELLRGTEVHVDLFAVRDIRGERAGTLYI